MVGLGEVAIVHHHNARFLIFFEVQMSAAA